MSLRNLPSIDRLLQVSSENIEAYGRPLTLKALRFVLNEIRGKKISDSIIPSIEEIISCSKEVIEKWSQPTLIPVINATGVILHTNLGRAPLSKSAISAIENISKGYSNLEFDLKNGKRGSRLVHAESILKNLTNAEDAIVVNNCASAVLLVLSSLANRKYVLIPRTMLVEIGGGFRVPDVMKQSGAKLLEIGTTNKVRIADFEESFEINSPNSIALVMRVHRSNFKIVGFTEEPGIKEIADIAHKHGVILVDDLGSGALIDTARYGLSHEPTIEESLSAGADVVIFSGDKLIGGPQAGIIIGKKGIITKIKRHPLARAVRADKTCLAALNATLLHYLRDEAESEIPIWRMISMPLDQIKSRAKRWQAEINFGNVIMSESTIGGGSMPGETIDTWVLSIPVKSPDKYLAVLRKNDPPIIARTQNDCLLFDPRTINPELDEVLVSALKTILRLI